MSRQPTITAPDWAELDQVDDPASETLLTDDQLAWYEAGCVAGIATGRQQAEDEMQAAWSALAVKVRALARPNSLSYAELCERRGEPERAERGRQQSQRVMTS